MSRLHFLLPALACLLTQRLVVGESLFDDDEVAAWKEKQAEQGEGAGESLFDDDEIAAWKDRQGDESSEEAAANEVSFDSKTKSLTSDIVFDERGNVAEGGNPDIAFYHVSEFNGERIDEPTHGSSKLMEAIEKGEDYEVKFAPPSFSQFQCTEKVQGMHQVLEQYSHEYGEEFLERVRKTLEDEGITNTKQLGELDEKDYDEIRLPALIKTRLRKVRAEARAQTEVAETKVEMDSEAIQAEIREYQNMRNQAKGSAESGAAAEANASAPVADSADKPAEEMEEEDGTFQSLVWAVMNCPTCKGKETIDCFKGCRYDPELAKEGKTKSWSDCLDECIANRWLRATFRAMLPSGS